MKTFLKVTGRALLGAFGLVAIILGLAMCLTLILIVPGILIFMAGCFCCGIALFGNPDTASERFPRKHNHITITHN